ncbi:MAG TPA: RNA polymerase factor sigma-54 [Bacilli bacterium]|nr:RNA polymerase factor sigma-54 [Bacilli bacterium]
MQMGYGLWQEQSQRLVMTQELRQAITMLQFSSLELLEYLEGELAQNPVIEADSPIDWAELARQQRESYRAEQPAHNRAQQEYDRAANIRQGVSLVEHLHDQLHLLSLSAEERRIGDYLIGNLDENGYLTLALPDCAEALGVSVSAVEQGVEQVQSLDPTGVGARTLAECLRLQLAEKENVPAAIYPLIDDHLEDVAQGRITRVAQALHVTPAAVQKMVDLLKTLDPKPGRRYSTDTPAYIIPDVTVEKVGGEYVVVVNDRSLPKLRINEFYRGVLNEKEGQPKETKEFITSRLNGALWLLKSLEQRRQTIYNVTTAIVELQRRFFDMGVSGLKPLTLRQVAEKVGLHESTVSRATTGKYAQTPRGVFELKYFFSSGVQTASGEGASAESIKRKIRDLIAKETPKKPLSDQKIADLLTAQGIEIARRTVAKYREEDGIPSSSQRKRYET